MTPSVTTRWERVEFEDSRFACCIGYPVQQLRRVVRVAPESEEILLEQRDGEVGFWDGHVWIPLRWVWRQIWRQGKT